MVCHHSTWRMTVNSSQPPAASDFDHLMLLLATFHEPAQLWEIDPPLLLVHITTLHIEMFNHESWKSEVKGQGHEVQENKSV